MSARMAAALTLDCDAEVARIGESLRAAVLDRLRRRGVIRADAEGRLQFDDMPGRIAEDAQRLLSGQLRHGILQVVQG